MGYAHQPGLSRPHIAPDSSERAGIAALIALGILQHFDLAARPVDHPETQHLMIEAMKLAFADVYAHVADARHAGAA